MEKPSFLSVIQLFGNVCEICRFKTEIFRSTNKHLLFFNNENTLYQHLYTTFQSPFTYIVTVKPYNKL